jgi:hypothetical protein
MQPYRLDDGKFRDLEKLIRKSFRVRENMTPIYVDIGGNLGRVSLDQHQIVFGRRGSGKSTLLLYFRRKEAPKASVHTIYINADTVKTLDYPDALIRILLSIFQNLPPRRVLKRIRRMFQKHNPTRATIRELRALLSQPSAARTRLVEDSETKSASGRAGKLEVKPLSGSKSHEMSHADRIERTREYDERKVQTIDNHLPDYKQTIQEELALSSAPYSALIIDDFYLIHRDIQPDVIDYIHRLLRDTDLYFKIGTVTHRSNLLRTSPIHIGIQPRVDVDALSLDQTLEDLDQTRGYLEEMLRLMGREVGVDEAPLVMSDEARKDLVLLSGGVPRDYLNVFVGGLERARRIKNRRLITPTDLRRAAAAQVQDTKLPELRRDSGENVDALEALFATLVDFCLVEKRKTAFLISEDEAQQQPEAHELIKQLMDCRLIHIVEPNTSAASGRPGRYEAYTLDFGLFMEPRKRNIEIVEFWETDDQRRRVRLREAPVFPLERVQAAISGERRSTAEQALEVAKSIENDSDTGELTLFTKT